MGYRVQQSIELQLHCLVPLPPHHFTCRTWDRLGIRGSGGEEGRGGREGRGGGGGGRGGEGEGRGGEGEGGEGEGRGRGEGRERGEEGGKKNGKEAFLFIIIPVVKYKGQRLLILVIFIPTCFLSTARGFPPSPVITMAPKSATYSPLLKVWIRPPIRS